MKNNVTPVGGNTVTSFVEKKKKWWKEALSVVASGDPRTLVCPG